MLESVGRGTLRLEIPANVAIDVAFRGTDGDVSFNMSDLSLERLNIDLEKGSAIVTFPAYQPLSSNVAQEPGDLIVRDGDITLVVPQKVGARFELDRAGSGVDPEFDAGIYNHLVPDILEARGIDTAAIKLRYIVIAPHGLIRVQTAQ
jgi:hypothetical protein